MIVVPSNRAQRKYACWVGRERRRLRKGERCQDKYNFDGDGRLIDEVGAVGQYAFARWRGVVWEKPVVAHYKDIGDNYVDGVRVFSTSRSDGNLLFHEDQIGSGAPWVLARVDVESGDVTLVGWMSEDDMRQHGVWTQPRTGRPCLLVEAGLLKSMDALP